MAVVLIVDIANNFLIFRASQNFKLFAVGVTYVTGDGCPNVSNSINYIQSQFEYE